MRVCWRGWDIGVGGRLSENQVISADLLNLCYSFIRDKIIPHGQHHPLKRCSEILEFQIALTVWYKSVDDTGF